MASGQDFYDSQGVHILNEYGVAYIKAKLESFSLLLDGLELLAGGMNDGSKGTDAIGGMGEDEDRLTSHFLRTVGTMDGPAVEHMADQCDDAKLAYVSDRKSFKKYVDFETLPKHDEEPALLSRHIDITTRARTTKCEVYNFLFTYGGLGGRTDAKDQVLTAMTTLGAHKIDAEKSMHASLYQKAIALTHGSVASLALVPANSVALA